MDNTLLLDIGKLLFGILILVYSGDLLVKGSVAIANYFKISPLVIGLTVVAFGTSAPELIVSMGAAISGHPEIALGNVIGSNIANIALVLGLTIIILPMPVAPQTIKRSWPIMFISGIMLYWSMYNGKISHYEGAIMVTLLILFIISSLRSVKKFPQATTTVPKPSNKYNIWIYILFVALASIGLAIGSKLLVIGASSVASSLGISERIISITIVAFGTSIPELTASVIAAFKKETDISVGNIIGSNIFNVFAVIGITSSIHEIPLVFNEFRIDLYFMIAFYILLLFVIIPLGFLFSANQATENSILKRYKAITGGYITRIEGAILFILYVSYIVLIFKT